MSDPAKPLPPLDAEVDRCLRALWLQLPEEVAKDVGRIVYAALAAKDAEIAQLTRLGAYAHASFEHGQLFLRDQIPAAENRGFRKAAEWLEGFIREAGSLPRRCVPEHETVALIRAEADRREGK